MIKETTYTLSLFGRSYEFKHSDKVLPAFILGLRLAMGWIFIWAGFDKLITDWSAGYWLTNLTKGPFKELFVDMGQSQAALDVVDPLVIWGQILIGFSLILGIFTRFGLLMAATQMFLFYIAALWPEFNPFMDEHIVYILIFALLGALGAGRVLGLDALLERAEPVKKVPQLEYVMG